MIKMNIIKYAFENSTQLNSTQLILYKKLFLGITISFSNDLLKYIQYFIHKLISLISVIFNAYYKKFNYKEFNMNNTKTIFKSLLIMIVAISLFTVSCSKDEGGTKNPTNPTIQKITDANLTQTLKDLGPLNGTGEADKNTVMVDFSKMTDPASGSATIQKAASESKSLQKVKDAITTVFQTPLAPVSVNVTFDTAATAGNNTDLKATIVFTAKSGFEFDTTITGGNKYTYDKEKKTATLILNIKPSGNWED